MENKHKQFKPCDRILTRDPEKGIWLPDFYAFFEEEGEVHATMMRDVSTDDDNILPFEGNEHLVGTTDEPEEEIGLKKGEFVITSDSLERLKRGRRYSELNKVITILITDYAFYPARNIPKFHTKWNLREENKHS